MQEDIKDRIKQIRSVLKLSQKGMAELLNIPVTTISKYERGENKPSSDIIAKIGDLFDINLNWLLTGKGDVFLSEKDKIDMIPYSERIELFQRTEKVIEFVELVCIKHKIFLSPRKKADLIRHLIEHEDGEIDPLTINMDDFENLAKFENKVLDLCYMIENQFEAI